MGTVLAALGAAAIGALGSYLVVRIQVRNKLTERRRDVYVRVLKWLLGIRVAMVEVAESLREGRPRLPEVAETLDNFEAELLIDGSDHVRELMGSVNPGFTQFLQRLAEIAQADKDAPDWPAAQTHGEQAYGDVMRPIVEELAAAMRSELT